MEGTAGAGTRAYADAFVRGHGDAGWARGIRKDDFLAGLSATMASRCGATAPRAAMAAALIAVVLAPNSTESAVANGDTRTVVFSNQHTSESGSFTYMINGVYDQAVLDKLNWFMRDWRLNEPTRMDPRLFDIIWEVYRESGSSQPIDVLSAYRSPVTNAMLRRRSRQVAEHSQHMEGRAIDAHFVDVGTARIRDIAMRMQYGGVGFYPTGATPWVHIDSGSVRYWPRMSRDALTRLFPDGKTVFIPADGQPMPGYELARAEIEARGGQIQTASAGGLFAWLFGARGGGADDSEESGGLEAVVGGRGGGRSGGGNVQVADAGPAAVEKAKLNLPTGPTYASAVEPARAPEPAAKPQVEAALEEPRVESDASPDAAVKLQDPIAALNLAPLPPRRPSDAVLRIASLANIPLPPVRPSDFVLANAPEATASIGPLPPARPVSLAVVLGPEAIPPVRPASLMGPAAATPNAAVKAVPPKDGPDPNQLPKAITQGVAPPATSALALAEMPAAPKYDSETLLARAAELNAPLPPMPIPNLGENSLPRAAGPASQGEMSGKDASKLFGFLPFSLFKSAGAKNADELRGAQQ